jgi:Kef-type K+ transport system membrane component KefB
MQHGEFGFLNFGLVLQTAAVLSVPIARRLGLSAIVAYLVAGIIIGPYELAAREVRPLNPEAEEIISHPPAAE